MKAIVTSDEIILLSLGLKLKKPNRQEPVKTNPKARKIQNFNNFYS
jgi:hypothetical protein